MTILSSDHGRNVVESSLYWRKQFTAQYLVRLEADCACSAHCKCRFICDADQS